MLKVISAILFLDADFVFDLLCLLNLRGQKGTTIKLDNLNKPLPFFPASRGLSRRERPLLAGNYHSFNMTKKAINTCNVISYGYYCIADHHFFNTMYKSGVKQASIKLIIEMEATSNTRSRKGRDCCLTTAPRISLQNCIKEIMLIRTKRAQTLELVLREHEQDIKSDVD